MINNGYQRSKYDSCVYLRKSEGGDYVYLLLYVDDMLLASRDKLEINKLKQQLKTEFEMKDLGAAKRILGMEISRRREKSELQLSQKSYLEKVISRFSMEDAKPVTTPIAAHFKLSSSQSPKTDDEKERMSTVPYASAIGSIMYAMVCSRPDLAYGISLISRFMGRPGEEHWRAAKWVLRYLTGTKNLGLVYCKSDGGGQPAKGYVDSDFAGDLDKRRSLTGYVFTLFENAVSWKATLQHIVALSTTEAEYIAVTEAIKEALWIKGLVNELGVDQKNIEVHCDNQSAIHLCKNPMYHERTKHIDIRLHFIRDVIEGGSVKVVKIHTSENPADMITKPVPLVKFRLCLDLLKVRSVGAENAADLDEEG